MTRSLHNGPSQARPLPPASGLLAAPLRPPQGFSALADDDSLDDPNLRRIDAFMADDIGLDDATDEI